MAIAFDTSVVDSATTTSTHTLSYTATGVNLACVLGIVGSTTNGNTVSGVTYNGVSMSLISQDNNTGASGDRYVYLFYLSGIPSGTHDIVATGAADTMRFYVATYTGVSNTGGTPDSHHTNGGGGTPAGPSFTFTVADTTIADNCWVAGFYNDIGGSTDTAGANTIIRAANSSGRGIADTNALQTPAGSHTLTVNSDTNNKFTFAALGMAPATGTLSAFKALLGVGI